MLQSNRYGAMNTKSVTKHTCGEWTKTAGTIETRLLLMTRRQCSPAPHQVVGRVTGHNSDGGVGVRAREELRQEGLGRLRHLSVWGAKEKFPFSSRVAE